MHGRKRDLFHFVWNDMFLDFIASGSEEEGERLQLAVDFQCSTIPTFPHALDSSCPRALRKNCMGLLSLQGCCQWASG